MTRQDLIVFGEDWGGLPSSTQHLIRHLLTRDYRVLWVNSIGLRKPRLTDLTRAAGKLRRALDPAPAGPADDGVRPHLILHPLAPPVPTSRAGRWLTRSLLVRQIRAAMARLGMHRPVVWTSLPSAVTTLGGFGESGVVYYCCDDFGDLVGVDHGPVLAMERELAGRADAILATTPVLADRFDASRTHLLPHGVDFSLFQQPVPPAPELRGQSRPVAGFYGSITHWLDGALLMAVAQRLPDWDFHLIGKVACPVDALAAQPNIRFLGPRAHGDLPSHVQHWQAALLPFRDTPQIRACNPLKLKEYLASGTPVVATRFPAVSACDGAVHLADTADDFAAAIRACLDDQPTNRRTRQGLVAAAGWADRAADADRVIRTLAERGR